MTDHRHDEAAADGRDDEAGGPGDPGDRPVADRRDDGPGAALAELRRAGVLTDGDRERAELVEYLLGEGASVAELIAACEEGDLRSLAGDRLIAPQRDLTLAELAARLDIEPVFMEVCLRTAGLPVPGSDELAFGERDVETFGLLFPALDLFPLDAAMQVLRVVGSSLARIADAAVAAYLFNVEQQLKATGRPAVEHAQSNQQAIMALESAAAAMGGLLARHMDVTVQRTRRARRDDAETYETVPMAVGFVDLVGYTSLSGRLDPAGLSALISRFEELAYDTLADHDGRVVKLIGDEVMYVTVEAADAVEVALRLIEQFTDSDRRVTPRGGVAVGRLLAQEGDYYGRDVNLASRVADLAVAGEVLVTDQVRDALDARPGPARYAVEGAGRRNLKGFDEPVRLWSVERA